MNPPRRRSSGDEGQAIIEFAVISIPLFLLFLLVSDAGMFFYGYVHAANAVREGARCAAVGGDTDEVEARVEDKFPGDEPNVTLTPADRSGVKVGDDISVTATWTYHWISPLAAFGLSDTTDKTYTVTMRAEGPEVSGKTCG